MEQVTFNHGVVGSNPAGLTIKIKELAKITDRPASQKTRLGSAWEAVECRASLDRAKE
jgi:hypothetical protein